MLSDSLLTIANGGKVNPIVSTPMELLQDGGDMADVEIEGGEFVKTDGNPEKVALFGGAKAKQVSPLGFVASGAKHGSLNQAGTEGIPMSSTDSVYVFSDRLDKDGFENKGQSIAKTAAKINKAAVELTKKPNDKFANNEIALNDMQNELNRLEVVNDQARFISDLRKLINKRAGFEAISDHIVTSMPKQLNPNGSMSTPYMVEGDVVPEGQPQMPEMGMESMMAHGGRNFQSGSAYKKWLAYGHASGEFAKTPGHQKVSIQGKAKRVQHGFGGRLNGFNY